MNPEVDRIALYKALNENRSLCLIEDWLNYNQTTFVTCYDDSFICLMRMPDYETTDYIE